MTWKIEENKIVNKEMVSVIYQILPPQTSLEFEEQKMIRESWGRILHEIDFPIQITARTLNNDLEKRLPLLLNKLSQQNKKGLPKFREWLDEFVRENCKPTRMYYITVAYKGNIQRDKLRACLFLEERQKKLEGLLDKLNIERKVAVTLRLRNSYEKKIYESYQKKRAMIGLNFFYKKNKICHFGKPVKNSAKKIKEFLKEQTDPFLEKKVCWKWKQLTSKELCNLWDSINNEGVFVNSDRRYWSIEELYDFWRDKR